MADSHNTQYTVCGPGNRPAGMAALFAEHLCDDEDKDGAAESSTEEEIEYGIAGGSDNGCEHCDHHDPVLRVKLFVTE